MGQQHCGCGPCDKDEGETAGKVDDVGRSGYALDKAAEETIFEPPNAPFALKDGRLQPDQALVDALASSLEDAKSAVSKAWAKFRGEFGVQVSIWGSLAIGSQRGDKTKKQGRDEAKRGIEAALQQFETDPFEAANSLEETLKGPAAGALNNATLAAAKQIQIKTTQASRREELSTLLSQKDAAVKMAPLHLERLIEECGFENADLESSVRSLLEMTRGTLSVEQ
ncbi:unnamed protein product [Effrenium voratum]|uniref:Uncharacterized protein n=1 Tax=Effrenium voratum TaxID=2562239 RepID=A0AA36MPL5_9DINO|nr:unnamed protein product [Effrenium voratum]CAJ1375343.1 unnamed protein product [Effrenium voratum]CAJ1418856.1 unnamed protein product [Effrenium voratum]|mmetsp:Transcript_20255/g.47986  ORF Transcript_20255/g.47986 Transcript_20255/m.47986 type:complete len:225 (-) Transcript_20255:78-752(-)